jgi:hypothetical protein
MARASSTAEDNALTGLVTSAAYFGANTGDPSTTGANEATYSSGGRAAITWGSASSGSIANATSALSLNISSSQSVDYFSTWGASSGTGSGGYQIGGALSATIDFVTNGVLTVAIGGLTLTAS